MKQMHRTCYDVLRAYLVSMGLGFPIGLLWYWNTLSTISVASTITTCIAGLVLGFIDFQKETSVFRSIILALFALAGSLASIVQILENSEMFCDLWGIFPWIIPLIAFAIALLIITQQVKVLPNNKELKKTQLTSH